MKAYCVEKVHILCAWSVAAGAEEGSRRGNGGNKVCCASWVGEGPWKERSSAFSSAGAERSGRLVIEMDDTNGKRKESGGGWNSDFFFCCFGVGGVGFFVVNVLKTPLNTHTGNLLRFICNHVSFCMYAS